jgi:hypothetical protein
LTSIQALTGTVQANAILNSTQPSQTETTDDILAAIINPPKKEGK